MFRSVISPGRVISDGGTVGDRDGGVGDGDSGSVTLWSLFPDRVPVLHAPRSIIADDKRTKDGINFWLEVISGGKRYVLTE